MSATSSTCRSRPVMACAEQTEETTTLYAPLRDEATYRYERGKMEHQGSRCHLADVERIMAYRALRIRAGRDPCPVSTRTRTSRSPSSRPARSPISSGSYAPRAQRHSRCCARSMPTRGSAADGERQTGQRARARVHDSRTRASSRRDPANALRRGRRGTSSKSRLGLAHNKELA